MPNPVHTYEALLLNKTLSTARSVAEKRGIEIRVIEEDGRQIGGDEFLATNRLNVIVINGIVTRLIDFS